MPDFYSVVGWDRKRCRLVTNCARCFVLGTAVVTSSVTLGGPSLPQSQTTSGAASNLLPVVTLSGVHSAFEEISPLIEEVQIKKGDPFVEVFVRGAGHLDCYDVREFQVERTPISTQIVPRLRRLNASKACKLGIRSFFDKAADLDPASPSTQKIEVLGYRGWVQQTFKP